MGPASNRFVSQRLKLHYIEWGDRDAPPLILLHGGKDHCRSWDWTAQELHKDWRIIAPDLRGHGDSAWSADGEYPMQGYVYDLAQLIHLLNLDPVTIVAHSLGGNVALRYTGLYPDKVTKLVAIEGLGPSPEMLKKMEEKPRTEKLRDWIDAKRNASKRLPKKYTTLEDALLRMKAANGFLSDEQAMHLTVHGATQNEDTTWSWKFDPYLQQSFGAVDIPRADQHALWAAITCPTMLVYGAKSWASNPEKDGRLEFFNNDPTVTLFEDAGHWVHHDQFADFMKMLDAFL